MSDPKPDDGKLDPVNQQDPGKQETEDYEARWKAADNALRHEQAERAKEAKRLAEYEKAENDRKQAEMTEVQKANAAKEAAEKRAAEAEQRANQRLIESAFISEASRLGVKYPEDAYALADKSGVSLDDKGKVVGVAEAVDAVVKSGRLPIGTPRAPGLNGGAGGATLPNRAMTLTPEEEEMAKKMGITTEAYLKSKSNASAGIKPGQPDDRRV